MSRLETHPTSSSDRIVDPVDQLIHSFSSLVNPIGYQVIHIEIQSHHQKTLRVFIDHLENESTPLASPKGIGIEDCVKVSRTLDEYLEQSQEWSGLLSGSYELEVSSPGVDRPLRRTEDFQKFIGNEVRIHLYRPLTADEMGNSIYHSKNPKQKNFTGTLIGIRENCIVLCIPNAPSEKQKGRKSNRKLSEKDPIKDAGSELTIPRPLISKANLEPKFELKPSDEREQEL